MLQSPKVQLALVAIKKSTRYQAQGDIILPYEPVEASKCHFRQCIHIVQLFVLHCTATWRQPGLSLGCVDFFIFRTN